MKPPRNLFFPYASPADIIRANQKDLYYQSLLAEKLEDVLQNVFGPRQRLRYQNEIKILASALYFGLTTCLGSQTLGEEYCDILPVDDKQFIYPSALKRSLFLMLHVFTPYAIYNITEKLRKREQQQQHQQHLQQTPISSPTTTSNINAPSTSTAEPTKIPPSAHLSPISQLLYRIILKRIPTIISHTKRFHLAIFYFIGAYYHLSKRISGIRYVFLRKAPSAPTSTGSTFQQPQQQDPIDYSFLGLLSFLQIFGSALQQVYENRKKLVARLNERRARKLEANKGKKAKKMKRGDGEKDVVNEEMSGGNEEGSREQAPEWELVDKIFSSVESLVSQGDADAETGSKESSKDEEDEDDGYDEEEEEEGEYALEKKAKEENAEDLATRPKCILCLSPREHATTTACGHVFCWYCIVEWCQTKAECPLCRQEIHLSRLYPLYNYL